MAPIMGIIFVIFTKKPIGNIINYIHKINMKKKKFIKINGLIVIYAVCKCGRTSFVRCVQKTEEVILEL